MVTVTYNPEIPAKKNLDIPMAVQNIARMMDYLGIYSIATTARSEETPESVRESPSHSRKPDNQTFQYDLRTKELFYYSYDESGHNGDHYNCTHLPGARQQIRRCRLLRVGGGNVEKDNGYKNTGKKKA